MKIKFDVTVSDQTMEKIVKVISKIGTISALYAVATVTINIITI